MVSSVIALTCAGRGANGLRTDLDHFLDHELAMHRRTGKECLRYLLLLLLGGHCGEGPTVHPAIRDAPTSRLRRSGGAKAGVGLEGVSVARASPHALSHWRQALSASASASASLPLSSYFYPHHPPLSRPPASPSTSQSEPPIVALLQFPHPCPDAHGSPTTLSFIPTSNLQEAHHG